jgi:hypothetical protein
MSLQVVLFTRLTASMFRRVATAPSTVVVTFRRINEVHSARGLVHHTGNLGALWAVCIVWLACLLSSLCDAAQLVAACMLTDVQG